METIILTFQYTLNDFVKAQRQYLIANKTIRKYDPALLAVFLLFSILFRFFADLHILGTILFTIALIVCALEAFLYFCYPILIFKNNLKYRDEYTLTFSNEDIKFKTQSIDSVLQWNIYSAFWESSDFYFLIQSPRVYTFVPKRVFNNPTDKRMFESMALFNIKTVNRNKTKW